MRCEKCGAEFMPPKNLAASFTNCPFCKATIFNKTVVKSYASFSEFLQYIVSIYGQEIYKDKQRLNGLIANFYNGERKMKRAYMRAIADDSISQKVYDILLRPSNEREAYYNKLVANFVETNFCSTEISQQIINDVILGISIEFGQRVSEKCKAILIRAIMGNADEQYNLGYCYCKGNGIEQNYIEAVKWFKYAAAQNILEAQCCLGCCYQYGSGVEQNYPEAVKWYQKAAQQGNDMAQFELGYCFDKGLGVVQNHTEAVKWYRMAAEQEVATAQCNLGYCYECGRGIRQDYAEAIKWYYKAIKQKDATAQKNLERLLNSQGIKLYYSRIIKWYYNAIIRNDANAQCNLGYCYESGRGTRQDYTEAVKWYQKAAKQGYIKAKNRLIELRNRGLIK